MENAGRQNNDINLRLAMRRERFKPTVTVLSRRKKKCCESFRHRWEPARVVQKPDTPERIFSPCLDL